MQGPIHAMHICNHSKNKMSNYYENSDSKQKPHESDLRYVITLSLKKLTIYGGERASIHHEHQAMLVQAERT